MHSVSETNVIAHPPSGEGETDARGATRKRVAVIDDEPLILSVVARCLGREYEVLGHEDGDTAVAWLKSLRATSQTPDIVLCDLSLGSVSGVDVFADIVRQLPELAPRVAFLTGGSCSPRDEGFLAGREAATLRKPFTPAALRAWVSSRIDAAAS